MHWFRSTAINKLICILGLLSLVMAVHAQPFEEDMSAEDDSLVAQVESAESLIDQDPDQAVSALLELLDQPSLDQTSAVYTRALFGLGLANYHRNFYAIAKDYFTQALATPFAQTDIDMRVRLFNNLGVVNDLSRNYDQALASYQAALEIERTRNRPLEMAEIYNNISLIYYNLGQFNDALATLDQAQALVEDQPTALIQALIFQNRAINYHELQRFDDYLAACNQALEIYRQQGQHQSELQIYFNLIEDVFRRTQDWARAEALLSDGLAKAQSHNIPIMQAYFSVQQGKLASVRGQWTDAIEAFDRASEQFRTLGFSSESLPDDLYMGSIEAYARMGAPDAMLETLRAFRAAELAREMAVQRSTVGELETQLAFNEQTNRLQQQTIELQAQQARNASLMYLAAFLLLLIVSLVVYHKIRIQNLAKLYALNQKALKRIDAQRLQQENAPAVESPQYTVSENISDEAGAPKGARWVFDRVEKAMTETRLYQQSGLTLPELSESLGLSKRLVSESINAFAGVSFPEYLNQHRVIYAMRLLDDAQSMHLSIDQILDEAGFSSRSAFYVVFRKACGMTPKEYRKMSLRQPGRSKLEASPL